MPVHIALSAQFETVILDDRETKECQASHSCSNKGIMEHECVPSHDNCCIDLLGCMSYPIVALMILL